MSTQIDNDSAARASRVAAVRRGAAFASLGAGAAVLAWLAWSHQPAPAAAPALGPSVAAAASAVTPAEPPRNSSAPGDVGESDAQLQSYRTHGG